MSPAWRTGTGRQRASLLFAKLTKEPLRLVSSSSLQACDQGWAVSDEDLGTVSLEKNKVPPTHYVQIKIKLVLNHKIEVRMSYNGLNFSIMTFFLQ